MARESLVLIPGLGCTHELYAPQIDAFAASFAIHVADHRQDATMAAIASRLLAAAPRRFALAGLSMGGYVALEVMRQAPERVARLALLDTNARADGDEAKRNRAHLIALADAGRYAEVTDTLWQRMVAPDRLTDAGLKRLFERMMAETGPAAFTRQQQAIIGRRDSRSDLPSIRAPSLVLVGEQDQLTPVEQSQETAALIPGADLVIVPGSGHLSTLEDPAAVNAALARWLAC